MTVIRRHVTDTSNWHGHQPFEKWQTRHRKTASKTQSVKTPFRSDDPESTEVKVTLRVNRWHMTLWLLSLQHRFTFPSLAMARCAPRIIISDRECNLTMRRAVGKEREEWLLLDRTTINIKALLSLKKQMKDAGEKNSQSFDWFPFWW